MKARKARKDQEATVVIGRKTVTRWSGMQEAARLLGVSHTQVRRHVTGQQPSARLARRMVEMGIEVKPDTVSAKRNETGETA